MLHFKSDEDYQKAFNQLGNAGTKELDAWENQMGFTSIRRYTQSVLETIHDLPEDATEDMVRKIVNENSEYMKIIIDEDGDKILEMVHNPIYAAITNISGMVSVADKVYKITPKHIISTSYDNSHKIINLSDKEINNLSEHNEYEISKLMQDSYDVKSETCSYNEYSWSAQTNPPFCHNDRKVKLTFSRISVFTGANFGASCYYEIRGYRKRFCIWINYETNLHRKEIEYEERYPRYNFYAHYWEIATRSMHYNYYTKEDYYIRNTVNYTISTDNVINFSVQPGEGFVSMSGRASHRGMDGMEVLVNHSCN